MAWNSSHTVCMGDLVRCGILLQIVMAVLHFFFNLKEMEELTSPSQLAV